jgi:hypothetical protein
MLIYMESNLYRRDSSGAVMECAWLPLRPGLIKYAPLIVRRVGVFLEVKAAKTGRLRCLQAQHAVRHLSVLVRNTGAVLDDVFPLRRVMQ